MLRISKLADYGTVIMVTLAHQPETLHNVKALAAICHIAVPTVSKCLKLLTTARLLQSQRGMNGGYSLAKPASLISVAEIISAIEGSSGLTECSDKEGDCLLESVCMIRTNWRAISRAIHSALASVTVADLAKHHLSHQAIDVSEIRRLGVHRSRGERHDKAG